MAGKIQRELALLLTGKDVSMSRTVRGAEKSMARLNRAGAKAGSNIARNAEHAVVVGAVAATGAVAFAVNQAMQFESSSASVRKTVEGNVDAILLANRKLSTATGLDVNALNEISATAGALGVAKDDIDDFTKTVALLGVTTDDVTTDLGATSLGHLKTTLGLAGADFEHFGNTLVFLGNHGASTEGEILSMAENIAGAAATIGASTPQVLGWAAAVANTGEEAEAGGSSIQRFWLESFRAVSAGGDRLQLMAKTAGMTEKAFKRAFGKDASGTLAMFITKLGKLSKAEQLATLNSLGFKDIRITRALLKLLANTDNLTDSLDDSTKGWQENNAATEEATKRFATTEQKLAILNANVKDAAITIGSELLPVMADLSTEAVGWLQGHQTEIHQFAKDLSRGIRDAVTWAQKLDWEAIGAAMGLSASAAKAIVTAFMSMPDWVKAAVLTGWGLNKFTGGALIDVGKIAFDQFAGLGASPARPLWVQAVNAGGLGAAGASAGGGIAGSIIKGLLKTGALVAGGAILSQSNAGTQGAQGLAGNVAGGTLAGAAFGPLGALVGGLIGAVKSTAEGQSARTAGMAGDIKAGLDASIAGKTLPQLQTALAGVDQGIANIESNPLLTLLHGDALTTLKAMRGDLTTQIAKINGLAVHEGKNKDDLVAANARSTRIAIAAAAEARMKADQVKAQAQRTAAAVKDADASIDAGAIKSASAARDAGRHTGSVVSAAIRANRPIITTTVTVNVTAAKVQTATNTQSQYGSSTGSAGGGGTSERNR